MVFFGNERGREPHRRNRIVIEHRNESENFRHAYFTTPFTRFTQ